MEEELLPFAETVQVKRHLNVVTRDPEDKKTTSFLSALWPDGRPIS
jgi:hypothetical protein